MVGVLISQEQRHAALLDRLDARVDLLRCQRREAQRRFVDEQDLGLGHQAASQRQHPPLTARQAARELSAALLEPGKQLIDMAQALAPPSPGRALIGTHQEVLAHRHLGEEQVALGDVHHARRRDQIGPPMGYLPAVEKNLACSRRKQPRDGPQKRRLAVSVGTQDDDAFAVVDDQVDAVQHLAAGVPRHQAFDLKHLPIQCPRQRAATRRGRPR